MNFENAHLFHCDSLDFYDQWATPMMILLDGAYGIDGFDGDTSSHESLAEWYEPHVVKWSELCGNGTIN